MRESCPCQRLYRPKSLQRVYGTRRKQHQAGLLGPPGASAYKRVRMEKQREGGQVGVRTNFHFQFITTPTSDTPGTSLLLHFDKKRYVFGEITEGTQRACIQRGIGLKKVRGLFLAGQTHRNNGGLIGMILTMADVQQSELDEDGAKRPRLNIHAGPIQLHSLACARRFVFRTGMPLSVHEVDVRRNGIDPRPIHEDENIRVWALATRDKSINANDVVIDEARLNNEQALRKKVVDNMFDSDWRRDQLSQSKLKDIKLPAVVWVRDPETKSLITYPVYDLDKTPLAPDTDVLVRNPWPASMVGELPPASGLPQSTAMSYIIKGYAQRGNFDARKAMSLGLKPGPIYAKLVAGESVQSDDGTNTTITPEMVLSPTRPGRGLALFDVPSMGHLVELERQLEDGSDQQLQGVEAAVWLTRGDVLHTPRFQELLRKLSNIKHVISDPQLCRDYVAYDSSALASSRLSQIASNLFSIPRFDNQNAFRQVTDSHPAELQALLDGSRIVPARRGLKVHVEPDVTIDESEVVPVLNSESFSMPLEAAVQGMLPNISSYCTTTSAFVSGMDLYEPEIVTLGTGSAAPSKYRNVSAVLLRMPNGLGNYLFDCGEGTLGQLKRVFNAEQLDEILFNLRAIWISHLHADHHLGTVSVLREVYKTAKRLSDPAKPRPLPPYLISEVNMIDYMNDYQSVLGLPTETLCTPIPCDPLQGLFLHGESFDMGAVDPYIKDIRTVRVSHCHGAQAITVTFKNGFKFSYSGDCRPNEAFCNIGADSDVLVHEATFDDGMEGDARAKKHSTTGEAVGVALGMQAKNLILTHFSQRYQKIPVFSSVKLPEHVSEEEILDDVDAEMINGTISANDEGSNLTLQKLAPSASASSWTEPDAARDLPIAVAFDLMRIRVSQIKDMKKFFPAISKMFEVEEEKKDKAHREIVERQNAELEKRVLAREEAMAKNRQKRDQANRERQAEANKEKKSKKNKRKGGRRGSANGTDTQPAEENAPAGGGTATRANGAFEQMAADDFETLKTASNGVEAGGTSGMGIDDNTKHAQPNGQEVQMEDASTRANSAVKDAHEGDAANDFESQSPLKRLKTE